MPSIPSINQSSLCIRQSRPDAPVRPSIRANDWRMNNKPPLIRRLILHHLLLLLEYSCKSTGRFISLQTAAAAAAAIRDPSWCIFNRSLLILSVINQSSPTRLFSSARCCCSCCCCRWDDYGAVYSLFDKELLTVSSLQRHVAIGRSTAATCLRLGRNASVEGKIGKQNDDRWWLFVSCLLANCYKMQTDSRTDGGQDLMWWTAADLHHYFKIANNGNDYAAQ